MTSEEIRLAAQCLLNWIQHISRRADACERVIIKYDISKYFYRVNHEKALERDTLAIETTVFVYGDREKAEALIADYCEKCGLSVTDACRVLINTVLDGGSVADLFDMADNGAPVVIRNIEKESWREAARYARERERAQAQAYRLMMKHHKAREVMRFKRQKRIYGGLM